MLLNGSSDLRGQRPPQLLRVKQYVLLPSRDPGSLANQSAREWGGSNNEWWMLTGLGPGSSGHTAGAKWQAHCLPLLILEFQAAYCSQAWHTTEHSSSFHTAVRRTATNVNRMAQSLFKNILNGPNCSSGRTLLLFSPSILSFASITFPTTCNYTLIMCLTSHTWDCEFSESRNKVYYMPPRISRT